MYLLGLDLGTSSVKASVIDAQSQKLLASASYPETEAEIISAHPGWAEQDPDHWWHFVQQAVSKCNANGQYNPKDIAAIGIAYQMHGLVMVDKEQNVLRHSIIWCDSRAVNIGHDAFENIGEQKCLSTLLNSPGNFTASKLAWVKQNEPSVFAQTDKIMLPGDFIAMKFTGEINTSISALSEGVLWDFQKDEVSKDILNYYGFSESLMPPVQPLFSSHGTLKKEIAEKLSLKEGIPVTYKAGDQPNNALALNVLQPGEVATTAGTSGVIYGVTNQLCFDTQSRINSFAHVNYATTNKNIGVLLCINGTGIFNHWVKTISGRHMSYEELNNLAEKIKPGAEGLKALPFGNGAERMLNNKIIGAHIHNIDFNFHTIAHLARAVQEGIAFSFRYGLDIMRENGMKPQVVRAAKANMFLSNVFSQSFADVNNVEVEYYEGDGSYGAAIGAGIGAGVFSAEEAGKSRKSTGNIQPKDAGLYDELYLQWKHELHKHL
ncbi:MAG: carbohydrate kinase [Sphingobacteriales bacterium]|jgi:xylulokinase|nr:carbohydrate kinase [Sphingobacteriales bacterium]